MHFIPGRRADTLALKGRLQELLGENGEEYWHMFGCFLTGKATREEFDLSCAQVLIDEAAQCHNDLILAVLHNVTAPPLPSSSSRSSGWLKKRKQSTTLEFSTSDQETKRRRLNDAVMALGKKERARLKGLVHQPTPSHLLLPSSSTSDHITKKPSAPLGTPKTVQGRSAAFQQDFARCRNTPLCAESLRLPDMESLQARMSWSAYQADLLGGADTEAVSVLMAALTAHLQGIMQSVLEMKNVASPTITSPAVSSDPHALTTADLAVLSELAPGSLGQPPTGAVCRSIALLARQTDFSDGMTKTEQILDQCPAAPQVLEEESKGIKDPNPPNALLLRKHTIDPDQVSDRFKLPSSTTKEDVGGGDQVERDKSGKDLANEIFPPEEGGGGGAPKKKSIRKIASSSEDEAGKKEAAFRKNKDLQKKKDKAYLLDVVDTVSLFSFLNPQN